MPVHRRIPLLLLLCALNAAPAAAQPGSPPPEAPRPRVYELTQTVTLDGIPKEAKRARLWIALPGNARGQQVLDLSVRKAPGEWRYVREAEHGNRFLYVEVADPATPEVSVVVDCVVRRHPVDALAGAAPPSTLGESHRRLLDEYLAKDARNMEVTETIQTMADQACGDGSDVITEARSLYDLVAAGAEHYSKDPSKPSCGRGNAGDCLAAEGGCCTDMHSLFVALARAREIPARLQFGYRLEAANEGRAVDPGYRCWVEFFAPGRGWVPADVVEGDAGGPERRDAWFGALDEWRLWCCKGRDFLLEPRQEGGRVNNMIVGYAEIDGRAVRVRPDEEGRPSQLTRTVRFVHRHDPARAFGQ